MDNMKLNDDNYMSYENVSDYLEVPLLAIGQILLDGKINLVDRLNFRRDDVVAARSESRQAHVAAGLAQTAQVPGPCLRRESRHRRKCC